MKTLSLMKYTIIKIIRNKKNIFFIGILSLCSLLIITSLSISSYINDFIDKSINANVGFRTINVNPNYAYEDLGLEVLENNEHILENYSSKYSGTTLESSFKNDNLNGQIGLLYGSKYTQPTVIKGTSINDDDTGVAICPANFYPDDNINDLTIISSQIITSKYLYNQEFTVTYNSFKYNGYSFDVDEEYTKTFKVVGIYDNTKTLNMNNECYISPKDMKDIMDTIYNNLNEGTIYATYSVVDNISNMDDVMKELEDLGFEDLIPKLSIDTELFNNILNPTKIILIVVCLFILILSFLYTKKKVKNELSDIGMMKTMGFNKSTITFMYFFEIFILSIVSLIISIIVFQIFYNLFANKIFIAFKYIGIDLVNKFSSYLIAALFITIIPILSIIFMIINEYKKDIALLIGSDEV